MSDTIHTIADYLVNALWSAIIGAALAVALALVQGKNSVGLAPLGAYALVGITGGTCSKAAIEGAYALFGARKAFAYALNAVIVLAVILVFSYVIMGGLSGLPTLAVILIFALPEIASVLLVHAGLYEAERLNRAFMERRKKLDE
jgi:hypothetical protein